jgi:hypothetical protein
MVMMLMLVETSHNTNTNTNKSNNKDDAAAPPPPLQAHPESSAVGHPRSKHATPELDFQESHHISWRHTPTLSGLRAMCNRIKYFGRRIHTSYRPPSSSMVRGSTQDFHYTPFSFNPSHLYIYLIYFFLLFFNNLSNQPNASAHIPYN